MPWKPCAWKPASSVNFLAFTVVARNSHFRQVQTAYLVGFGNAISDQCVRQLEDDESKNSNVENIGAYADQLSNKLRRITVEQAPDRPRDTVPAVAVGAVGEQPQG